MNEDSFCLCVSLGLEFGMNHRVSRHNVDVLNSNIVTTKEEMNNDDWRPNERSNEITSNPSHLFPTLGRNRNYWQQNL